MGEVGKLAIEVDTSQMESAIETIDRLTDAVTRAREAIESLNGAAHGGISIAIVGGLAEVKIEPAA